MNLCGKIFYTIMLTTVVLGGGTLTNSVMAGNNSGNTMGLYGSPKMYGEYEAVVTKPYAQNIYGSPADFETKKLYVNNNIKKQSIKVQTHSVPIHSVIVAKKNIKPKHDIKEKSGVKKSKPSPLPEVPVKDILPSVLVTVDIIPMPPLLPNVKPEIRTAAEPVPVPAQHLGPIVPTPLAQNIAKSLTDSVDVDSYCGQINSPVKGPLPRGIVLMPGRTDLMSCVQQ